MITMSNNQGWLLFLEANIFGGKVINSQVLVTIQYTSIFYKEQILL